MSHRLKNRTALVTGAARGIGRAIALGLAREGADVVVNDLDIDPDAESVTAQIRRNGGRAVAVQADVGDLSQHDRLLGAAAEHFGPVDILVNNAATTRRQAFAEATPEAWDRIMAVNLKGVYFLAQAAARTMARRRAGKIINISSVHDTRAMPGNSIYSISKSGVAMLTKALALELAEHGIQVNAVAPGAILTDQNRDRLADPEHLARVLARIPTGRIGQPEDIVGAVVLLASAEADYLTGATLRVDGGMLLQ